MAATRHERNQNNTVNGGALPSDATPIARCLPALGVLEQHDVTYLSLMVRVEDGMEVDTSILHPRFFEVIGLLETCREEVGSAVRNIMMTVASALEQAVAGDDALSDFFACVTVWRCDARPDWSMHCEVVATVTDCNPRVVITLR